MFDSGSMTPLPLDPEGLRAFVEGLPPEVVEQFIKNWRGQNEARERSQTENLLLHELLRRQRIEKYSLSSERLSGEELERPVGGTRCFDSAEKTSFRLGTWRGAACSVRRRLRRRS